MPGSEIDLSALDALSDTDAVEAIDEPVESEHDNEPLVYQEPEQEEEPYQDVYLDQDYGDVEQEAEPEPEPEPEPAPAPVYFQPDPDAEQEPWREQDLDADQMIMPKPEAELDQGQFTEQEVEFERQREEPEPEGQLGPEEDVEQDQAYAEDGEFAGEDVPTETDGTVPVDGDGVAYNDTDGPALTDAEGAPIAAEGAAIAADTITEEEKAAQLAAEQREAEIAAEQAAQEEKLKALFPWRQQLESLPWYKELEERAMRSTMVEPLVDPPSPPEQSSTTKHTRRYPRYKQELPSHTRPQLGPQPDSEKRSEAAFSFGKGARFIGAKQFISKEHNAHILEESGPGPAAYSPYLPKKNASPTRNEEVRQSGGFGGNEQRFAQQARVAAYKASEPSPLDYRTNTPSKQLSKHPGAGSPSLTTALRKTYPCKGFEKMFYGIESPGPKYRPLSPQTKLPIKFEDSERGAGQRKSLSPGPGAYKAGDAYLKAYSKERTISFPITSRSAGAVVSLPQPLAATMLAGRTHESGPAAYDVKVDYDSKHKRVPGCGLGAGVRFPPIVAAGPGPGTYVV